VSAHGFRIASTSVTHDRSSFSITSDGRAFAFERSLPSGILHAYADFLSTTACGERLDSMRRWDLPWPGGTARGRCPECLAIAGADIRQIDWQPVEVHQATGMVAAQVGCDVAEAFGRLTIRAEAAGLTIDDLARDVLNGFVSFAEYPDASS
jgi:hypothetical protein